MGVRLESISCWGDTQPVRKSILPSSRRRRRRSPTARGDQTRGAATRRTRAFLRAAKTTRDSVKGASRAGEMTLSRDRAPVSARLLTGGFRAAGADDGMTSRRHPRTSQIAAGI